MYRKITKEIKSINPLNFETMSNDVIGYYNPIKIINKSRKQDISSKELDNIKDKQDQKQAVAFLVSFMILTAIAIYASHLMTMPY